jgi:hypothetical protein
MSTQASRAAWREYMRVHGRCRECAKPWAGTEWACEVCRAKRRARYQAQRDAAKAARIAAGGPDRSPGWNLRGRRPPVMLRTPEERRAMSLAGAAASARSRRAAVERVVIDELRRVFLNVRSDFTAEQMADLEHVVLVAYKLGERRGAARARRVEKASEAAA